MKAVLMAGGEGSRLRPMTIGRPKPMVTIVNKPNMVHIIDLLKKHGITDIIVTLQYMANVIQDHFGNGSGFGVNISYTIEESPLGTAGSVKMAELLLDEPFLVISGDALTDFDLTAIINYHNQKKSMATLTLTRVPNPLEYGVIITDDDGHVRQFLEKPSWGEVFSDTVNTGIYVLDPKVFEYMEPNKVYDWSTQIFPQMLERGEPIFGYIAEGYWCDVGSIPEYMRATGDYLRGETKLDMPGKHIGGGVYVEEDVEIASDAQLYGPVYLGQGVKIKGGVIINGPSVVRDYTVVDTRAHIDRSIIWRNSYIGERAEVHGAIISSNCAIKSKAMIFEGVVIGDDTTVDEGAVIQPNVKIWPNKEIETGATVTTSIIWGSQGRKTIFGRYGVSGLVNIDITPEYAAKLGAAYGATLPKGAIVTVNREVHYTPRMIKRAIISGIPSAGCNVADLRSVPIPVARYFTRVSEAAGGVHVRLSPMDNRVIDIKFFDRRGLDIDKNTERKIEQVFFREDFRRAYLNDIGRIEYTPNVIERYTEGFLQFIDVDVIRKNPLFTHIVVDYAGNSSANILPSILGKLGIDVVALNATGDELHNTFYSSTEFQEAMERLGTITSALQAPFGVRIDSGGERMFLVDDQGRTIDPMKALAAVAVMYLKVNGGGAIAVPVTAPSIFEKIAAEHGGEVVRTKVHPYALMSVALRNGVVLVGDSDGTLIFPQFHPGSDALFAIVKIIELTAKLKTRIRDVINSLPSYSISRAKVPCRWEDKGKVMRMLNEQYRDGRVKQIDGVRIEAGHEWVLILPDADRPLFHIIAESDSDDHARSLVEKYSGLVNGLQQ